MIFPLSDPNHVTHRGQWNHLTRSFREEFEPVNPWTWRRLPALLPWSRSSRDFGQSFLPTVDSVSPSVRPHFPCSPLCMQNRVLTSMNLKADKSPLHQSLHRHRNPRCHRHRRPSNSQPTRRPHNRPAQHSLPRRRRPLIRQCLQTSHNRMGRQCG